MLSHNILKSICIQMSRQIFLPQFFVTRTPQTHARLQFTILGVKHMKMWQIFDKIRSSGHVYQGKAHWG